jgi:hypothetical protein
MTIWDKIPKKYSPFEYVFLILSSFLIALGVRDIIIGAINRCNTLSGGFVQSIAGVLFFTLIILIIVIFFVGHRLRAHLLFGLSVCFIIVSAFASMPPDCDWFGHFEMTPIGDEEIPYLPFYRPDISLTDSDGKHADASLSFISTTNTNFTLLHLAIPECGEITTIESRLITSSGITSRETQLGTTGESCRLSGNWFTGYSRIFWTDGEISFQYNSLNYTANFNSLGLVTREKRNDFPSAYDMLGYILWLIFK